LVRGFIGDAKIESVKLEKLLKKINDYLATAPKGCLKWQHRRQKIYYYQQYGEAKQDESRRVWMRKYITNDNISLAKGLAQKQYYLTLKRVIEQRLKVLNYFLNNYQDKEIDDIYYEMCEERRSLIDSIELTMRERIKQWQEQYYEGNMLFPERLRYETEQGERVRSKSEVIIANHG